MILYNIRTLPNGKAYGEMVWRDDKFTMHADSVRPTENAMMVDLSRQVRQMVRTHVFAFLSWRKNSLRMADRNIWPSTQEHMMALYGMVSKTDTLSRIDMIARVICEHREHISALQPALDNYLWKSMGDMILWAGAVHSGENVKGVRVDVNEPKSVQIVN